MNLRTVVPGLLVVSFLAVGFAQPAHAQGLGVAAGLNFNQLNDITVGSGSATYDNSTGYHVGVVLELGGGPLSFRPGVFYHQLGRYDFPAGERIDLTAIEVPLDVRLSLATGGALRPYVLAAPVLTLPRSDDFEDAVKDMTLTADLGVGFEFGAPGAGLRLMPELRYSVGVTDYLSDDFQIGDVTVTPADSDRRFSRIMLRLNVMF
jgi:hypothetical protein